MSEAMDEEKRALIDLLKHAQDQTDNQASYVNNALFSVGASDVTIDFFLVSRDPLYGIEAAERVSRIIIPLSLAKDMSTSLLDATNERENTLVSHETRQIAEVELGTPGTLNTFEPSSKEKAWEQFDELMAQISESGELINDLDDEKLEQMRASADERLKWLYDSQS